MELVTKHIKSHLNQCLVENTSVFSEIFENIQNENKIQYKSILSYLDFILKENQSNNKDLKILHLHFQNDFSESITILIAEFLIIRFFTESQNNPKNDIEINIKLSELKETLLSKLRKLSACPDGASAKNKNRIYKNWIKSKNNIKSLITFYNGIGENKNLCPKVLFNCQIKVKNGLKEYFNIKPFAIDVEGEEHLNSYCVLNSEMSLNELDGRGNVTVDDLENLILFDCERKKIMSNFTFEEIRKWNLEYNTSFKQYLLLSFGQEENSIHNLRNKIETIKDRFKIPLESSYTILSAEINNFLNEPERSQIPIEFIGLEISNFWDTFLLETTYRGLYELRSIKMMNIYSLCLNEDIKNYILEELFSKNETSKLISHATKQAIIELREEDITVIRNSLENSLNLIINSEIKSKVIENIDTKTSILLDDSITFNSILIAKISNSFGLTRSNRLISWSGFSNLKSDQLLILSYRDQGKFPNCFYPNIIESSIPVNTKVSAIFFNFFFGNQYNWSKYYLLKDLHKYLNHSIRQNSFAWHKFRNTIETIRPKEKLKMDWNLEYEYLSVENRETYRVKLKNQRAKTYNSSDLFIFKDSEESNYIVVKADKLLSLITKDEHFYIQNLDEIQENINIYEKISDQSQQEEELNIIRKQFHLGDESAGRLWKTLLKSIAAAKGEDFLYNELKIHFENKGLKIVSFFHFKNSWINPQSESIAPLSKRIFIELCEYLNIPKVYFVIIQRIRNASKQSSRQSTRQMNQLLKDLFNDGCFNENANKKEIINNKLSFYKLNHPLDELGIDENYLLENLVTLTELIQPELNLLELESIEKHESNA